MLIKGEMTMQVRSGQYLIFFSKKGKLEGFLYERGRQLQRIDGIPENVVWIENGKPVEIPYKNSGLMPEFLFIN